MNTPEFLKSLEVEERRCALLEDMEKDLTKKTALKRERRRISKLIARVRRMATGRMETANGNMDIETPENNIDE